MAFARFAGELDAVSHLDHERGYPAGSEGGRTRAKARIWLELDDFVKGFDVLREATSALKAVAAGDDRKAKLAALAKVGVV